MLHTTVFNNTMGACAQFVILMWVCVYVRKHLDVITCTLYSSAHQYELFIRRAPRAPWEPARAVPIWRLYLNQLMYTTVLEALIGWSIIPRWVQDVCFTAIMIPPYMLYFRKQHERIVREAMEYRLQGPAVLIRMSLALAATHAFIILDDYCIQSKRGHLFLRGIVLPTFVALFEYHYRHVDSWLEAIRTVDFTATGGQLLHHLWTQLIIMTHGREPRVDMAFLEPSHLLASRHDDEDVEDSEIASAPLPVPMAARAPAVFHEAAAVRGAAAASSSSASQILEREIVDEEDKYATENDSEDIVEDIAPILTPPQPQAPTLDRDSRRRPADAVPREADARAASRGRGSHVYRGS